MEKEATTLSVLIVKPGMPPYEAEIKNTPETFAEICGGAVESSIMPQMGGAFYCNATGKEGRLPMNRLLDYGNDWKDIICGTFIIFGGLGEAGAKPLTPEQMDFYKNQFSTPEYYETEEQIASLLEQL